MKAAKKNNALVGIKKEQLKRRVFTVEFKAEVVRHKKAENLSAVDCARKFGVVRKLGDQSCFGCTDPAKKWAKSAHFVTTVRMRT